MKPVSKEFFTLLEGNEYLVYTNGIKILLSIISAKFVEFILTQKKKISDQIAVNFACLDDLDLPEDINIGLVDGASHD